MPRVSGTILLVMGMMPAEQDLEENEDPDSLPIGDLRQAENGRHKPVPQELHDDTDRKPYGGDTYETHNDPSDDPERFHCFLLLHFAFWF
jgi:hypothetical protein